MILKVLFLLSSQWLLRFFSRHLILIVLFLFSLSLQYEFTFFYRVKIFLVCVFLWRGKSITIRNSKLTIFKIYSAPCLIKSAVILIFKFWQLFFMSNFFVYQFHNQSNLGVLERNFKNGLYFVALKIARFYWNLGFQVQIQWLTWPQKSKIQRTIARTPLSFFLIKYYGRNAIGFNNSYSDYYFILLIEW